MPDLLLNPIIQDTTEQPQQRTPPNAQQAPLCDTLTTTNTTTVENDKQWTKAEASKTAMKRGRAFSVSNTGANLRTHYIFLTIFAEMRVYGVSPPNLPHSLDSYNPFVSPLPLSSAHRIHC